MCWKPKRSKERPLEVPSTEEVLGGIGAAITAARIAISHLGTKEQVDAAKGAIRRNLDNPPPMSKEARAMWDDLLTRLLKAIDEAPGLPSPD